MKQFAEITYDKIDENADYDELINKVVSECFEVENMSDMSLYLSIRLTNNEVIKEILIKQLMCCLFQCLKRMNWMK